MEFVKLVGPFGVFYMFALGLNLNIKDFKSFCNPKIL